MLKGKRLLSIVLTCIFLFSLTACSGGGDNKKTTTTEPTTKVEDTTKESTTKEPETTTEEPTTEEPTYSRQETFVIRADKKDMFEKEFRKEFGDKFLLMPMEEAIEKNLFGTGKHHECFRAMLGDYLAIATDNLTIYFTDEKWLTMHGSLTEEEMLIPFIVFEK